MTLHVIYTGHGIYLSKQIYSSWKEIQEEYCDYKTSLGPWSPEEVIEYLNDEYSDLTPSAEQQVSMFIQSMHLAHELKYRSST